MLLLQYKTYNLAFEYPFEISKGMKTHQPTLLLSLHSGRILGFGEATAITYYDVTIDNMIETLESKRHLIEKYAMTSPERFWHFLHHLIPDYNFLIAALDIAAWDFWAKMKQQPLWQTLGLQWSSTLPTDYTIGTYSKEEVRERVQAKPFSIYKLKVGSENDLEILETLRSNTNAIIRIDANEGWKIDTAVRIYPYLEKLKVEMIEQPFHRDDMDALQKFKEIAKIPIIADEACRTESDLEPCLHLYDGINIKLSKCGGITPALRMIDKIKSTGKKVLLGGMCESYCGATALANLLPLADYADIDGPLLLKENIGKGIRYNEDGFIELPTSTGTGFSF